MRFEVKRSEWYRGENTQSALFVKEHNRNKENPHRCRCCLGFFANACGLPDKEIAGLGEPSEVPKNIISNRFWDSLLRMSPVVTNIININDDETTLDKQKEEQLVELFDEVGHEIVFVD